MAASGQGRSNYLKAAFWNAYNLLALAGVTAATAATHDLWIAGAGVLAEVTWIVAAPEAKRFKRAVDARLKSSARQENVRRMQDQVALLPSEQRQRVHLLGTRAAEIKTECQRNPKLQGEFMGAQLDRIDELLAEFIHLAVIASKCESYLARADTRQLSHERDTWRAQEENAADDPARDLARQNLIIIEKRLLLVDEIGKFVERARGQMALIQNTVALLRDQVMTMATPESLTLQLDELITSVEAIREATREVESVVTGHPMPQSDPVPEPEPSRSEGQRIRT